MHDNSTDSLKDTSCPVSNREHAKLKRQDDELGKLGFTIKRRLKTDQCVGNRFKD